MVQSYGRRIQIIWVRRDSAYNALHGASVGSVRKRQCNVRRRDSTRVVAVRADFEGKSAGGEWTTWGF
eukprot:1178813-Prorocentrum_minimum.AAC.1